MSVEFVNLHSHTSLGSMLDALNNVGALFEKVKSFGQQAIAITDHGTMAAHFDAYKASLATGVQFIPGCEFYFVNSYEKDGAKSEKRKHLVLLAKNHNGYKNLLRANFMGFENQVQMMGRIFPRISWDVLEKYSEDLICMTACASGPISVLINEGDLDGAEKVLLRLYKIFKENLYLEIQPHHLCNENIDQRKINSGLIEFGQKFGIPIVVATDTHYITREDEKYHDVLMAINSKKAVDDPDRHRYGTDDFYVRTGQEVFDFLKKHYGEEVAIEAVKNTVDIAKQCEPPSYIFQNKNHLPVFNPCDESDYDEFVRWRNGLKKEIPEDKAFMRFRTLKGFEEKFGNLPKEEKDLRWERVKKEIKVLEGNDFSSYMLIVSDFIRWAKKNNIVVGPGRGCTSKDTLVLTEGGYKRIIDIKIGERVFTHTGELKEVENTFEYDINNESCVEIKTDFSFNNLIFTKDHKLLVEKSSETKEYKGAKNKTKVRRFESIKNSPEWIESGEISCGDFIFMPWPKKDMVGEGLGLNFDENLLRDLKHYMSFDLGRDEIIRVSNLNLAKKIREMLLYLKIPSSISLEGFVPGKYFCKKSYKIRFSGLQNPISDLDNNRIFEEGYFVKVKEIREVEIDKVYDIQVKDNHSYLTQNFASHNSAGGSLVAYLLDIHKVDPLQYGLLFERFQNAYKKDLPDIDTDFSSTGRDLVKDYCRKKYGAENCAQISNITTYSPKSVIPGLVKSMRNVMPNLIKEGENHVRVSESIKAAIPDQYEDEITGEKKKVKTLSKALSLSPELVRFSERCPELMEYAEKIIGLPSTFSSHAAALIIADQPIVNIAPLRIDKDGIVSVQYEKQRSESLGLIKMDLLSVSTFDVIGDTINNIQMLNPNCAIKTMDDIPLDDEDTFKEISKGQTRCVFQFGKSTVMMQLCKNLKPKNISDLGTINALGRPSSSKEERQEFIDRRFGRKEVRYLHSCLENALKETFGLGIFEEQMMLIAKDAADWDLDKADGLRKLTKLKGKDPALAEKLEIEFIEGCMRKHNMPYEKALEIWEEIILPFAKYGFNKSHAIFYAINGYMTAYLKRHFPAEFFAAYLRQKTNDNSLTKDVDIAVAKAECKRMGVKIIPPDVNKSGISYEVLDSKTIIMGLKAIKGMGDKAVEDIFDNQPFSSFVDFVYRTNSRAINKAKIIVLAKAGCFDSMGCSRKSICEEGIKVREKLNAYLKKKEKTTQDITILLEEFPLSLSKEEFSKRDLLKGEQEVLGELVSGTISDMYPGFFSGRTAPFSKLKTYPDRDELLVEFVVKAKLREFKLKTGKNIGKFMIKYNVEDLFGSEIELTVWPTEYEQAKRKMLDGVPVIATCQISDFNGQRTLMLRKIEKIYNEC